MAPTLQPTRDGYETPPSLSAYLKDLTPCPRATYLARRYTRPSCKLFRILRRHTPDKLVLVTDLKVQRSITENDEELKGSFAMFALGNRALEALFQPKLVAVDAIAHGAEGANRWQLQEERKSALIRLGFIQGKEGGPTACLSCGGFGFFAVQEIGGELPYSTIVPPTYFNVVIQ